MSLTATDFFCGMGGSSTGMVTAGYEVKLAANHWERAIESHSANHPDTEHLCAAIETVDLRYLPRTDVLWASPICTEVSPAGGRRRKGSQLDLFEEFGHVPSAAFERTRVTFWEVIRATELHRYKAVMIENVVEAAEWELFDIWLGGMLKLGYQVQFISVSAAHVGDDENPHAPQWRDRIYLVFLLDGIPMPDLQPRPLAWCPKCEDDVPAQQWWKRAGRRIGKYGPQYLYVCPVGNHGPVEPYVAPASVAIDWTDLGTRIGDREKPLSASTMRRIEHGLRTLGDPSLVAAVGNTYDGASGAKNNYLRAWPVDSSPTPTQVTAVQNGLAMSEKFVMGVNHGGSDGRPFDPDTRPNPTSTIKEGKALVATEPFVTMLRNNGKPTPVDEPLRTLSTGRNHGLTIPPPYTIPVGGTWSDQALPIDDRPMRTQTTAQENGLVVPGSFVVKQFGGQLSTEGAVKPVTDPLHSTVAKSQPTLVIPYRKGSKAYPAETGPLSTVATRDQHGVLHPSIAVEDCYFRMLSPREAANSQRFPREYVIHGNKGEQQMQAGNAVAVNVAQWIAGRVMAALEGTAA